MVTKKLGWKAAIDTRFELVNYSTNLNLAFYYLFLLGACCKVQRQVQNSVCLSPESWAFPFS